MISMSMLSIYIYINPIRSIYRIQAKSNFINLYLYIPPEYLPIKLIHITINTIQYKENTQ